MITSAELYSNDEDFIPDAGAGGVGEGAEGVLDAGDMDFTLEDDDDVVADRNEGKTSGGGRRAGDRKV